MLVCYSLLIISYSTDSATRALGAGRAAAGSALFTCYQRSLHRWFRRRGESPLHSQVPNSS